MNNIQYQIENKDVKSNSLNILFFHNTLPEYRIGWFKELNKKANVEFVFTNEKQNEKDYGFKIEYNKVKELKCFFCKTVKKVFKSYNIL